MRFCIISVRLTESTSMLMCVILNGLGFTSRLTSDECILDPGKKMIRNLSVPKGYFAPILETRQAYPKTTGKEEKPNAQECWSRTSEDSSPPPDGAGSRLVQILID